jgi:hypothetical protein
MPLSAWARLEPSRTAPSASKATDDLRDLFAGLSLPPQIAAITYPRGCRIRRVRVRALEGVVLPAGDRRPLIVSRRALEESRAEHR